MIRSNKMAIEKVGIGRDGFPNMEGIYLAKNVRGEKELREIKYAKNQGKGIYFYSQYLFK